MDMIDGLGEDGGAFVFQSDPNVVADGLNSLGINSISHSVAVTFDAAENKEENDPVFDHISIQIHGDLDHYTPDNLAGPISMEPYYSTRYPQSTTFRHLITIDWDPVAKKLSVFIDGAWYFQQSMTWCKQFSVVILLFIGDFLVPTLNLHGIQPTQILTGGDYTFILDRYLPGSIGGPRWIHALPARSSSLIVPFIHRVMALILLHL